MTYWWQHEDLVLPMALVAAAAVQDRVYQEVLAALDPETYYKTLDVLRRDDELRQRAKQAVFGQHYGYNPRHR